MPSANWRQKTKMLMNVVVVTLIGGYCGHFSILFFFLVDRDSQQLGLISKKSKAFTNLGWHARPGFPWEERLSAPADFSRSIYLAPSCTAPEIVLLSPNTSSAVVALNTPPLCVSTSTRMTATILVRALRVQVASSAEHTCRGRRKPCLVCTGIVGEPHSCPGPEQKDQRAAEFALNEARAQLRSHTSGNGTADGGCGMAAEMRATMPAVRDGIDATAGNGSVAGVPD